MRLFDRAIHRLDECMLAEAAVSETYDKLAPRSGCFRSTAYYLCIYAYLGLKVTNMVNWWRWSRLKP